MHWSRSGSRSINLDHDHMSSPLSLISLSGVPIVSFPTCKQRGNNAQTMERAGRRVKRVPARNHSNKANTFTFTRGLCGETVWQLGCKCPSLPAVSITDPLSLAMKPWCVRLRRLMAAPSCARIETKSAQLCNNSWGRQRQQHEHDKSRDIPEDLDLSSTGKTSAEIAKVKSTDD